MMAAGLLPKPGTEYGPCLEVCLHRDCQANRAISASACRLCDEEIGFGRAFYDEGAGVYVHALCLDVAIEMSGKAKL